MARTPDKARENRLRDAAERRGLLLSKSRMRDPGGLTYGHYRLEDDHTAQVVAVADPLGRGYPFRDLDAVEAWLNGYRP
jgi:hypothetical protein